LASSHIILTQMIHYTRTQTTPSNTAKVAVLGGGILGLVSANYLVNQGLDVTLISEEIGGSWQSGGLKLLKWHPQLEQLLAQLKVPFFVDEVEGAVWWKEHIIPLSEVTEKIQQAHFLKTRGTMDGYANTCMNAASGQEKIIDIDFNTFVQRARKNINIHLAKVVELSLIQTGVSIDMDDDTVDTFDYVVTSLPLWLFRRVAAWHMPNTMCNKVHIADTHTHSRMFWRYKYVYFPENGGPHRISTSDCEQKVWMAEITGVTEPDWIKAITIIQKTIKDARLGRVRATLPGHIYPLTEKLNYPINVLPVGRFASWNPRETVDKIMDKLSDFVEHVCLKKCGNVRKFNNDTGLL